MGAFCVNYRALLTRINDWFREFRKFCETSNGRLPLKHGSDRPQTWPKRVSDDPRHFIFRWKKLIVCKFRRSVYSPRMAPIGVKLWGNAFHDGMVRFGARGRVTSAEYIYWKRLPLEHGSDRPQTLGKRVSDDLQLSIFQLRKKSTPKKNCRRTFLFLIHLF